MRAIAVPVALGLGSGDCRVALTLQLQDEWDQRIPVCSELDNDHGRDRGAL